MYPTGRTSTTNAAHGKGRTNRVDNTHRTKNQWNE